MADHSHGSKDTSGGGARRWVFWGFVLVAAYFLLTEHRAHAIQYLPFLLLLACPIMHLFHGHGGHGDHRRDEAAPKEKSADADKKHGGCH